MKTMHIEKARKQVIEAGIRLLESGLVARTWGNVSCRISDTHFVITPSGRDYRNLRPEWIVPVSIADLSWPGDIAPSGERGVHREVYRLRPDVGFVIHTHQEHASVASCLGLSELPAGPAWPLLGGVVPCAPYALPGTRKIQAGAARVLPGCPGNAILLQNHGTVCFGRDAEEAFQTATQLESASLEYLRERIQSRTGLAVPESGFPSRLAAAYPGPASGSAASSAGAPSLEGLCRQVRALLPGSQYLLPLAEPFTLAWARTGKPLLPLIDDFPQIIGPRAPVSGPVPARLAKSLARYSAVFVPGLGALVRGDTEGDLAAAAMILEKNAKAMILGDLCGGGAFLSPEHSRFLRKLYLEKYAPQMDAR